MPNDPCPIHGGLSPGAQKGNKRALRHSLYSAAGLNRVCSYRQAMAALRPELSRLLRSNGERRCETRAQPLMGCTVIMLSFSPPSSSCAFFM